MYVYDSNSGNIVMLDRDAWAGTISPDGNAVAYLNSYRTGGSNLYLMDSDGRNKRRLTTFSNMVPVWVGWDVNGRKLFFQLTGSTTDVGTWEIRPDGSNLRKLSDWRKGQWFPPAEFKTTVAR